MSLTGHQIELATVQNCFANYYKHVEEFIKWCEHLKAGGTVVKSRRKLHRALYPHARNGDFALSKEFLSEFDRFLSDYSQHFYEYSQGNHASFLVRRHIRAFAEKYWLTLPDEGGEGYFEYATSAGRVIFPPTGLKGLVEESLSLIKSVDELLSFDPDYVSNEVVVAAERFNTAALPRDPDKAEPFTLYSEYGG
jgi:hypothetical protein